MANEGENFIRDISAAALTNVNEYSSSTWGAGIYFYSTVFNSS